MRSASATRRLISESVSLRLALSYSLSMYLFSLCFCEMGQAEPSSGSFLRLHLRGTTHKLLSARGSTHSLCMTDKSKSEDLTGGVWLHN